jgi:hypothetical protein
VAKVPELQMTKALALLAQGLMTATWLPDAVQRGSWALDEAGRRSVQSAWGYEFDVQTRWSYYRAGSPNIIVSAFVIEALVQARRELPRGFIDWVTGAMWCPRGYFRYVPSEDVFVHNANLLGARALSRVDPQHAFIGTAIESTRRSQRQDGTWPYGDDRSLDWTDNFHTAYILLALLDLGASHPAVGGSLERGVHAWLERCFAADGAPTYYADRPGPVDVHNIATALYALARLAPQFPACRERLRPTLERAISLQGADGAFRAKPGAVPFMRWNQAHMHLALAELTR